MKFKNFEQFLIIESEDNIKNLRFEDQIKLESDISKLLEIYQEYYDNLETAKNATYSPKTVDSLNNILDGLDSVIAEMKKIKK